MKKFLLFALTCLVIFSVRANPLVSIGDSATYACTIQGYVPFQVRLTISSIVPSLDQILVDREISWNGGFNYQSGNISIWSNQFFSDPFTDSGIIEWTQVPGTISSTYSTLSRPLSYAWYIKNQSQAGDHVSNCSAYFNYGDPVVVRSTSIAGKSVQECWIETPLEGDYWGKTSTTRAYAAVPFAKTAGRYYWEGHPNGVLTTIHHQCQLIDFHRF